MLRKKRVFRILLCFLFVWFFYSLCYASSFRGYTQSNQKVIASFDEGTLVIQPLTENAVRIKFYNGESEPILPELVFISGFPTPHFVVLDSQSTLTVKLKNLIVLLDKHTGTLSFVDGFNKPFLKEVPHTRKLIPNYTEGENFFLSEVTFESPNDEFIFGLGQFQDGHFNLRGVARRLIQVNSQISIPMIYSSKGYGLIWHNYGLTDYNPTDNSIELKEVTRASATDSMMEVTTTAGSQKVLQTQSLYTGVFTVPQDGEYCIFLDLGEMGNRHFVAIDGKPCIDQTNLWLPPTASALVQLSAGKHTVHLVCKSDNHPKLSWRLKEDYTVFRSPHAKLVDYIVMYGPSADTVIATYRKLTGNPPMFPLWAYGFWQCRERYTSSKHLVETVKEFRKRNIPFDVIVQDWQYWGNKGWGVPVFDEAQYPNPSQFIKEIHDLNAHFAISIWSNPDKNSELGKKFEEKSLYIPNSKWLDYYNPVTQKEYWNILNENMFKHGVDAWWMDATEPENDDLKGRITYLGSGNLYRLTYPLMVSKAVYEGQRSTTDKKRVCILTRSAFLGQQRYGIINWSGDIGGDWDTFKRQIKAGLHYSITGLPYWTTDIGGFFRPGRSQYTDEKYHELLIRWFQWGAFNPIFRVHGYQSETEPWHYGKKVEEIIRNIISLRYRLIPYIYSEAWKVSKYGSTIMRALVMDFKDDTTAMCCPYEFMFGTSILVAPVTEPSVKEWEVYLPKSVGWYDFESAQYFKGGKKAVVSVSLDKIPLFIREGSILPIGPVVQYASPKQWNDLEIRIYEGANGEFVLYEDQGDTYNYEKGIYSTIVFQWNDTNKVLTISKRNGSFPGMLAERVFKIVMIQKTTGKGVDAVTQYVHYNGKEIKVRLK